MHSPELSIVMPAYNEEKNIESSVKECMVFLERGQIAGEVIVVNDGSQDGTAEILHRLGRQYPQLRYIHLKENSGYGTAIKKAIDMSQGTYVVSIDSDGQFDIQDTDLLIEKIKEGFDCVTGYRKQKKDTYLRVIANWAYNLLVRLLCGVTFKDAQCALKIYQGDLVRSLVLEARGFTFPTEVLIRLTHMGKKIAEVPVNHRYRTGGESTIRLFRTTRIMFLFLIYIRFKLSLLKSRIIY